MPYIKKEDRTQIRCEIGKLAWLINTPGEMNFAITTLIHCLLKKDGINYAKLNEIVGVLECVKLELNRTVIGIYESKKAAENGSISILGEEEKP